MPRADAFEYIRVHAYTYDAAVVGIRCLQTTAYMHKSSLVGFVHRV